MIGVTHSRAIELFVSKDAVEFGGRESSTTVRKIRTEAPLMTWIPAMYSTITYTSLFGKNKALAMQIKTFMQNWNSSFCIHLNGGNRCLSSQQQPSGHYPQVPNETLSLHFSGFVSIFSESRSHIILLCQQREAWFLNSAAEKALTEMYAEVYFGEGG